MRASVVPLRSAPIGKTNLVRRCSKRLLEPYTMHEFCKRLVPSRLHDLKHPFVSRIELIRSKFSNFSAHVSGATDVFDVPSRL